MTGSDPQLTSLDRNLPGTGCRRPISQVLGTFKLIQGCNSQEVAVMGPDVTGSNPEETSFNRKSPGMAVEGLQVKFWIRLSSYRAVTRSRWQSRDRN